MRMDGLAPEQQPWKRWWVVLWFFNMGLITALMIAAIPFVAWFPVAVVCFGVMEGRGLLNHTDPYPPLTEVCREYLPRWLTFLIMYALIGLGAGTWFHIRHRWWLMGLGALSGWLIAHFTVTYDAAAILQEQRKYDFWAAKITGRKI